MSLLTSYNISNPRDPVLQTRDRPTIARVLSEFGVRFEQWPVRPLAADDDTAAVLKAYQPEIDRVKAEHGYVNADVVRLTPDHPDRDALRLKFIEEHTHTDDEVRFFAEGSGAFYLHLGDEVLQVICEAGDLISVPATTKHWFDTGPTPFFTAIRLFVSPAGWVGHFTGDPVSSAIPRIDGVAA